MIAMIKNFIKKLIWGPKYSSGAYIKYLRQQGVRIGERTVFFAPKDTQIDVTRPFLIEIGNDVQITEGVTILSHGYDWSVLKGVYGDILGSAGKVTIGNNVFIGVHTTILKGVTVGNNVIIGANSLVNRDIPDNVVVAGNPAKVIMSIEDYYQKRIKCQYKEAAVIVKEYRKVYGKNPDEDTMSEFFWLFDKRPLQDMPDSWKRQMYNVGNLDVSINQLSNKELMYDSMEAFFNSID